MYVVKKDIVEEASSVWSYVVKKLDLEPLIQFLTVLLKEILKNLNSYAAVEKMSQYLEIVMNRLELFKKFGII